MTMNAELRELVNQIDEDLNRPMDVMLFTDQDIIDGLLTLYMENHKLLEDSPYTESWTLDNMQHRLTVFETIITRHKSFRSKISKLKEVVENME